MKKIQRYITGVILICMIIGNTGFQVIASEGDTDIVLGNEETQNLYEDVGNNNTESGSEEMNDENNVTEEPRQETEDESEAKFENGDQDLADNSALEENPNEDIAINENETTDNEEEIPEENDISEGEEQLVDGEQSEKEEDVEEKTPIITYQVHVQNKGWMDWVKGKEIAGTTGESLRVEAVRIKLETQGKGDEEGKEDTEKLETSEDEKPEELTEGSHIEYRVHIRNKGWQSWKKDGELAGTIGESLQIEAIQIRLTGPVAQKYEVYYKSHVATFGWLGLVKGEELSGTEGMSKRIEAISIGLEKSEDEQELSERGYVKGYSKEALSYSGHVQNIGNTSAVHSGDTLGTIGSSKRLEAFKITLDTSNGLDGVVEYQAHVQNIGWQSWKENGQLSGTIGESKRMEAVKIRLKGDASKYYDIYYRAHVQSLGWLGWAKNGQIAGTTDSSLRMEALQIVLVVKGDSAPGENSGYYMVFPRSKSISGVPLIKQYPDFPNGCEAISLNMVMRYLRYEISNSEMCNIYLPKGPLHSTDPYKAYMGNPAGKNAGYGCWASVIVKTANKYFGSKGISPKAAKNVSGSTPDQLYQYIALGKPVIVWVTLNMGATGEWFKAGTVNGKAVYWPKRAHCMVMTGYDLNRGVIKVNDPIQGKVEYSMSAFEKAYKNMGKNAVIIE